jgi:TM2 domain-containing membrane protein YozV
VNGRIASLRRVNYSAGQAFALGIIVPGAGQFYTRRPGWGVALLAATGGAIGYALAEQTKITTKQQTATDPFGNSYTYTATFQGKERPGLVTGLAAAGALDLVGAIEAAVFAHQRSSAQQGPPRVSVRVVPSAKAVALRLRF